MIDNLYNSELSYGIACCLCGSGKNLSISLKSEYKEQIMAPKFLMDCTDRAFSSINELKAKGKAPSHLEISSDVWGMINMCGINMFPGQNIFIGFNVVLRDDLEDYICAVALEDTI